MRLIDADELNFEKLQDTHNEAVPALYIAFLKGAIAAKEIVKNAPTIDAEPVVRCKDCKYFLIKNKRTFCKKDAIEWYGGGYYELTAVEENHYCSYGAKMDEEQE